MKRVTLDSNIYISALVFGGKPKRILEMAIEGQVEIAISDSIIEEVRRHLPLKFGWSDERTTEAVESINEYAVHVTPSSRSMRASESHPPAKSVSLEHLALISITPSWVTRQ